MNLALKNLELNVFNFENYPEKRFVFKSSLKLVAILFKNLTFENSEIYFTIIRKLFRFFQITNDNETKDDFLKIVSQILGYSCSFSLTDKLVSEILEMILTNNFKNEILLLKLCVNFSRVLFNADFSFSCDKLFRFFIPFLVSFLNRLFPKLFSKL